MSARNVELLRRLIEAFNARNIEAFIACCDPSIEFQSVFAAVGGADYRGHDGLRQYFRDLADAWGDEIRIEPEAYFDLGEHALLYLLFHGRGRNSGVEVVGAYAFLARWRDSLIVYMRSYVHREEALRDLGVSEDELEPIEP